MASLKDLKVGEGTGEQQVRLTASRAPEKIPVNIVEKAVESAPENPVPTVAKINIGLPLGQRAVERVHGPPALHPNDHISYGVTSRNGAQVVTSW